MSSIGMSSAASRLLQRTGPAPLVVGAVLAFGGVLLMVPAETLAKAGVVVLVASVAAVWPMPFLIAALALAAGLDYSLGIELPVLVQLSGFRVTTTDALIVLMAAIGFVELVRRHEGPVFWKPLALLFGCVVLSWIVGTLNGTTDFHRGLNELRYLEPYALYFGGVGIVGSRTRLSMLKYFCFAAIVLSVARQLWQISSGTFSRETTVELGNAATQVPYVRLALLEFVLIGTVIAFLLLLSRGFRPWLLALEAVALAGIVVQLSRQWLGFTAIALLTAITIRRPRKQWQVIAVGVLIAASVVALVPVLQSAIAPEYGGSVLGVVSSRFGEIPEQGLQAQSAMGRFITNREMWQIFKAEPVFGLGPGQSFEDSGFFFTDVGFLNTLVRYGIVGLAAVFVLIGSVVVQARRTIRRVADDELEAYAIASIAVLLGFVAGYAFTQDFFTLYPTGVVMAMILVDRAGAASRRCPPAVPRVRPVVAVRRPVLVR